MSTREQFWIKIPEESGGCDKNFPESDHRHFFAEGRAVEVLPDSFAVKGVDGSHELHWVRSNVAADGDTAVIATELLGKAHSQLRLIEWESLLTAECACAHLLRWGLIILYNTGAVSTSQKLLI